MSIAFLNAWGLLLKGGAMMWPIAVLSIIAFSIAINKFMNLNDVERSLEILNKRFLQEIRANKFKEAVQVCEEEGTFLGEALKTGVLKYGASREALLAAMEEKASFKIHQLKQQMDLLALITNVAPVLGLLGTISSMSVVFHAVQMRSNALNPLTLGDMSSGIWQALLTTVAGLMVGVLALTAHSFCASRINDVIMRIDRYLKETASLLQGMSSLEFSAEDG